MELLDVYKRQLSPLPNDFVPQRIGKLDGFNIAQGLPLELIGQVR